ncbi:MAG: hypothetical protein HY861_05310 [Chlamydiia bacterium]|nr:hypothetical protein [Chlamydiia bacterium]
MRLAIVANTGLGDALWMMIVASNARRQGHRVVLYTDYLCHLEALFPSITIRPYPKDMLTLYNQFDRVLLQAHSPSSNSKLLPPHAYVLHKETLNHAKSYVQNLADFSNRFLNISTSTSDLDIQIPQEWRYRKENKRVTIHPSSANEGKNWLPSKFIRLAKKLQIHGYHPLFTLPPNESALWNDALQKAGLPSPLSLDWMGLAQLIYESGFLIGNDASAGHLASSLHIPTLSLFDRKSRAHFWRPGWGPGNIVLPYPILPGRFLRKRYWKQFLSVGRVLRAFSRLRGSICTNIIPCKTGFTLAKDLPN